MKFTHSFETDRQIIAAVLQGNSAFSPLSPCCFGDRSHELICRIVFDELAKAGVVPNKQLIERRISQEETNKDYVNLHLSEFEKCWELSKQELPINELSERLRSAATMIDEYKQKFIVPDTKEGVRAIDIGVLKSVCEQFVIYDVEYVEPTDTSMACFKFTVKPKSKAIGHRGGFFEPRNIPEFENLVEENNRSFKWEI